MRRNFKVTSENTRKKDILTKMLREKVAKLAAIGSYQQVADVCDSMIRLNPQDMQARENKAVCMIQLGKWAKAIEIAGELVELGHQSWKSLGILANAHSKLGNRPEVSHWGTRLLEHLDRTIAPDARAIDFAARKIVLPPPSPETRDKNIIAFSLYGGASRYCDNAIDNALARERIYPHWTCHFHVDGSVPSTVIDRLREAGAVIIDTVGHPKIPGTMWRFLSYDNADAHRILFRDADAVISSREKEAVDEWLESDRHFHIMRDATRHFELILAGMWGCVKGSLPEMTALIGDFSFAGRENDYYTDQLFLREKIWPFARHSLMTHDSVFGFMEPRAFREGKRDDDFHVGSCQVAARGSFTVRNGRIVAE